jgi:formylglycine-generating enzyme required for sulfatase activity
MDERRLLRGGSWDNSPALCRSASRDSNPADCRSAYRFFPPDIRNDNIGFRVCCLPQD